MASALAAQVGSVRAEQKISDTEGGFGGNLDQEDFFGTSVAALGDLDGDGLPDVAVGAHLDDDVANHGAVWILFLNADGTVKAEQKINANAGRLRRRGEQRVLRATYTVPSDWTGDRTLAQPGQGLLDLTTLVPQAGFGSIATASEAAGFDPTGVVRIDWHLDGSGALDDLALCTTNLPRAAASVRNGSGANPTLLATASRPVLGSSWSADLDCRAFGDGFATLWVRRQASSGALVALRGAADRRSPGRRDRPPNRGRREPARVGDPARPLAVRPRAPPPGHAPRCASPTRPPGSPSARGTSSRARRATRQELLLTTPGSSAVCSRGLRTDSGGRLTLRIPAGEYRLARAGQMPTTPLTWTATGAPLGRIEL